MRGQKSRSGRPTRSPGFELVAKMPLIAVFQGSSTHPGESEKAFTGAEWSWQTRRGLAAASTCQTSDSLEAAGLRDQPEASPSRLLRGDGVIWASASLVQAAGFTQLVPA